VVRSSVRTVALAGVFALVLIGVLAYRWWFTPDSGIGTVVDEALQASPRRPAASFPAADEDYFHDMDQTRDGPIALSPEEVKGRNTWIVWSAGNDRMWETLGDNSTGALDFLKVLSSHPSQKYSRACDPSKQAAGQCENRWEYFGLVNEPCFEKATAPDPNRFGLWLDKRKAGCAADPFENGVGERASFTLSARVLEVQTQVLDRLMSDAVAMRLLDGSFKASEGKSYLSLSDLYDGLQAAIWGDLKGKGDIGLMRRNLQREHVRRVAHLLTRGNGAPADARALQRENAKALIAQLRTAQARPGLSKEARAHLADSLNTLEEAVKAPMQRVGV